MTASSPQRQIASKTQRDVLLVMPADRRASILECFEALGIEANTAATCREARRVLKHDHPTPIVVTGVTLDDGNWSDLLRFVVDNDVRTRVVIVAPDADAGLWSEVVWRGGHDLLIEPCQRAEVDRVLDSAFRSQSEAA
jgi:DNA-binding NtrC family response regulator